MDFERIIQIPGAWTCVSGRFGVHLFEGQLTVADMDRLESLGDEWYRRHPGKLVELVIVLPSNTRMTHEERVRMSRLIKRWEKERIAAATVILAAGMLGAMQRSVLTGLLMLAPPPHPSKVFGTIEEAVAWLAPHVRTLSGPDATRDGTLAAVLDLYSTFQAR